MARSRLGPDGLDRHGDGHEAGELCALKWDRVDFAAGVVVIRTSIAQRGRRTWEKDTKTHQQRRISLDADTLALLEAYRRHCSQRAGIGAEMPARARIFSSAPDGSTWLKPDTVSQKYARMCARLGWDMNIHQLAQWLYERAVERAVEIDRELLVRPAEHKTRLGDGLNLLAGAALRYRERLGLTDPPWTLIGFFAHGRLLAPPSIS